MEKTRLVTNMIIVVDDINRGINVNRIHSLRVHNASTVELLMRSYVLQLLFKFSRSEKLLNLVVRAIAAAWQVRVLFFPPQYHRAPHFSLFL